MTSANVCAGAARKLFSDLRILAKILFSTLESFLTLKCIELSKFTHRSVSKFVKIDYESFGDVKQNLSEELGLSQYHIFFRLN